MRLWLRYLLYLIILSGVSTSHAGAYEDFFIAVIRDDASTVRNLLTQGVDPNSRDPKGFPALALSVRRESPRVFATLLEHPGVDVNALNSAGESALMLAAIAGDLDACQRLLARGAQIQQAGWSALHYAASGPETKIVQLLLELGATVDAEAPNGTTPLMLAAQHAPEATVNLLLQHGADTRRRTRRGLQAVDFAELGGRAWLVERFENLPR